MPTTQDNIDFMRNPNRWPLWPRLPIKRTHNNVQQLGCMLEFGFNGVEPNVYHMTVYDAVTIDVQKTEYKSFEDLVADGWEVD